MKWLVGTILVLAVGIVFQLGFLTYAMCSLVGILLASRYLAHRWISSLAASRDLADLALEIGEGREIRAVVENRGRTSIAWLLVEEGLPLEAINQQPQRVRYKGRRMAVDQLGAGRKLELAYRLDFLMRGYYQIGPLIAETGDLFGLYRKYQVLAPPCFVTVPPKAVDIESYDIASKRPIGEVRMSHRLFEDPTRLSGVRAYEVGDPFNRIHWRATARLGSLQSKTYEPSCVAGISILLDFHRESFAGDGSGFRAELAVTAAASLARTVFETGQQIGLLSNGGDAAERLREQPVYGRFRSRASARRVLQSKTENDHFEPVVVPTRRGPEQLDLVREQLARLEWSPGPTFAEAVDRGSSRLPRDASVVAILGDVTEETAQALHNLAKRGFAVTAVVVLFGGADPDWATPPDWVGLLMGAGIDLRMVSNEEGVAEICRQQVAFK